MPLNKWVNVVLRVDQHKFDVIINGSLIKRRILEGVPKQNYFDVNVSMNGGFPGYNSELRYFASALGTAQIQNIVDQGPNLKVYTDTSSLANAVPYYLSTRWYFAGVQDQYNP